jgi:hypothetical protein
VSLPPNPYIVRPTAAEDLIEIALPVPRLLTNDQALDLAAWLMCIASPPGDMRPFEDRLEAILHA